MPQTDGPIYAIVSTARFLLLVELNSKKVRPLEWGREEYYGVSWFPGSTDLVLSHSSIDNASLVDVHSYVLSEVGYISCGEVVSPNFLSQPHQIFCGNDGRVICTNTGRNAVCAIDLAKPGHIHEARISDARWDKLSTDDTPGDHINSVFLKDDVLHVVAHGHAKGSMLARFSYPALELLDLQAVEGRTGLHNIWISDDGLRVSCHSEVGAVVELDGNTVLWESGEPVYTRGLAVADDFILVGESQKTGRVSRLSSMSGMWLLDRKTWRALDYFCLGPYGAVHEVRLVNLPDAAHHGHVFEGWTKLLSVDHAEEVARERLAAVERARRTMDAWQAFRVVYGKALPTSHGGRKAGSRDLCLLIERNPTKSPARHLRFGYSLDEAPGQSHVAMVCYRGDGGDTHMTALLIARATDRQAALSLWEQDGKGWTMVSEFLPEGVPLAGEVRLDVGPEGVTLRVGEATLLEEHIERLETGGVLGIRWIGSTIYPPDRHAHNQADEVLGDLAADGVKPGPPADR